MRLVAGGSGGSEGGGVAGGGVGGFSSSVHLYCLQVMDLRHPTPSTTHTHASSSTTLGSPLTLERLNLYYGDI